jgi:hypothetical protein
LAASLESDLPELSAAAPSGDEIPDKRPLIHAVEPHRAAGQYLMLRSDCSRIICGAPGKNPFECGYSVAHMILCGAI